jgi:cytochrome c biogenesis protein CcmG, thiol:disulfide interchange protein DsbE
MSPATDEKATRSRLVFWVATIPLVLFLGLAALFLKQLATGGGSHDIPSALVGQPAPKFELPPLAGLQGESGPTPGLGSGNLAGRASIVNVWASWCVPCRAEHPILSELAKDSRVQLVGINYKDRGENALRFLGQLGNPFAAVGVDPGGKAAIDWGVYGVPETFIVDINGIIRYKQIGPLTAESYQTRFLPELEKALAVAPLSVSGS